MNFMMTLLFLISFHLSQKYQTGKQNKRIYWKHENRYKLFLLLSNQIVQWKIKFGFHYTD
jgi:hypothetical protein